MATPGATAVAHTMMPQGGEMISSPDSVHPPNLPLELDRHSNTTAIKTCTVEDPHKMNLVAIYPQEDQTAEMAEKVGIPEIEMAEIVEIEIVNGDEAVVLMVTTDLVGGVQDVADTDVLYVIHALQCDRFMAYPVSRKMWEVSNGCILTQPMLWYKDNKYVDEKESLPCTDRIKYKANGEHRKL